MKEPIPQHTRLEKGQTLHLFAPAGMSIVAACGTIQLMRTADWIADCPIREHIVLQEGEAHVLQGAGWVAISAASRAEVVCLAAAPRIPALLRRVLAFMRRNAVPVSAGSS